MEKELIKLILYMGSVIRYLDKDEAYCKYWLNDGEPQYNDYVPALEEILTKQDINPI